MEIMDALKHLWDFIIAPLAIGIWWFFKKHITRIDGLEQRVVTAEKAILVMESQMRDISKDIDEIKAGINKLVDKLL